jgi:3-oxoacyl-[acyl-carrier protein] reductase
MRTEAAMPLGDRTVIVTGAGHGLGRAYALTLGEAGANVVCSDIDEAAVAAVAREIERAGGRALARRADVMRLPDLVELADAAAQTFGGIHGLVNNAGVQGVVPMSRVGFEDVPDAEWDLVFDTNVKGTWYACRAVAPYLRGGGGGSIVNASSNTHFIASPTRIHYVASKSAIIGFTRVLSRELGPAGVRVNAIALGSIATEEDPASPVLELRRSWVALQAMPTMLEPADAAGLVVYLLSDASRYLTGQTIVLDGGAVHN